TTTSAGEIRRANLDGTSPEILVDDPAAVPGPAGIAIDHGAGKIYWANFFGSSIWSGGLDGTGRALLFDASTNVSGGTNFPVLLRAPVPTGRPSISGGAKVGKTLTCSQGTWASDLLGAFLFRAPTTFAFQWKKNGSNIAVTTADFAPTEAGDYSCTVTA